MEYGMPFLLETKTIEDACILCQALNLAFVELNMNFPQCCLNRLNTNALNALKQKYGLYFTLHLDENLNVCDFNPLVREAYLQTVRDALSLARAIDVPIVNMHLHKGIYITLPDQKTYLFARYAREYTQAILAFRSLCKREIGSSGIKLAIENTDGFASHEKAAVERLLECPVFGLTLDIGHSHAAHDTDMPFYEAHLNRLCHMHVHDARSSSNHLALGDGEIDLRARLQLAANQKIRAVIETKTIDALKASGLWLAQAPQAQA